MIRDGDHTDERSIVADLEKRVARLETRTEAVAEAIRSLAHGLEEGPLAEPGERTVAEAARRAYELLLITDPHRDEEDREAPR
ncbi:hypothetical protein [Actinoallomurus rhizosphaericola]|uniref:hypothetical protein n=1 Tax=Actinoallomurus rhizosphaericola TaxID=2952536 RepID=UPI0020929874|nr:hypothetical protein [Actinoallomurus rhizosphaericola]MCO5995592.1 hypothetical protein [Actinoallomurus rhizosphaericola]